MTRTRWLTLVLAIIFIGVSIWVFRREKSLVRKEPVTAWAEDHRADCAVVLTGGPGRVREGFDLLAQRQVQVDYFGRAPKRHLKRDFSAVAVLRTTQS